MNFITSEIVGRSVRSNLSFRFSKRRKFLFSLRLVEGSKCLLTVAAKDRRAAYVKVSTRLQPLFYFILFFPSTFVEFCFCFETWDKGKEANDRCVFVSSPTISNHGPMVFAVKQLLIIS